MQNYSTEELKTIVERLERLNTEKDSISDNIREIFNEAKGQGFDPKIIRQVLKIRKAEPSELEEQEYILTTYLNALGMIQNEE